MSRYYYQPGFSVESTDIFSSVFSVEEGKERYPVLVKLKSNAIDFSYVKINMQHPIHPEVVIPWFSVDLKESEHTDFFLQHAHDFEKKVSVENNTDFHIHYFWGLDNKDFLKNEPFIKSISVRHLLLCLFDDLNNPLGDFRKYSPEITKTILSKLNESKVYKLIWRKYSFYRELYDYETSNKHPEYYNRLKVLYAEYLPLLLNDDYYKEIPCKTLQKDDFWLQNPEEELDKLAEINKKYRIDDDSLKTIQNYFLKRHAVLNALKINAESLFIPIIATSALAGLLFLINWICWFNNIFKHTTWIWGTGGLFFRVIDIVSYQKELYQYDNAKDFCSCSNNPFALVGAEELFTSMIGIKTFGVVITAFLCLIIITFFLFSESRQHSPAYKVSLHPKMYNIKITPILLHALNFANVLVLGLQLVIMPRMVERSDYIKSDIFASKLNEIEYTLQDCESTLKMHSGLINMTMFCYQLEIPEQMDLL